MQIRVVKEDGGQISILIVSQGTPPLPAVAVQHLAVADVAERVASELADFKRVRSSMVQGELC